MDMATKHDIFKEHLRAWLEAKDNREKRKEIVEHICFTAHVHPKSVSRGFRRAQMRDGSKTYRRGRSATYGPDVTAALKVIWEMASEPCAENIHPLIAEYVAILRRDGHWKEIDSVTEKLLVMSLGTMKKRIGKFKRRSYPSHGKSTTNPSAIHTHIPIRIGPWDKAGAGTIQIDTVAHCGHSTAGDYVFTVNSTDIATLWGTRRAQWNKGQTATVRSMEAMEKDTPFPLMERHPDSGSEFINWHCLEWSEARGQKLTRSRPNHKNDNCFVEERNGHVVRRYVGYARLDRSEYVDVLNSVYDVLTPYLNHFIASRRTLSKERIGSKWKIARERIAMTPYQRVLARHDVTGDVKEKLRKEHDGMSPLLLKQEIDRRLRLLFTTFQRHASPDARDGLR
jgi:hypothetical protein